MVKIRRGLRDNGIFFFKRFSGSNEVRNRMGNDLLFLGGQFQESVRSVKNVPTAWKVFIFC